MTNKTASGHRERLRDRFISGEDGSHADEALLELLLTYSIPQKDVQPLARKLLSQFGNLPAVLAADLKALCNFDGIKTHSAVLINLIDWIRCKYPVRESEHVSEIQPEVKQKALFTIPPSPSTKTATLEKEKKAPAKLSSRRGTELFGKAVLKKAIALLPKIPDTESLGEVRQYLRNQKLNEQCEGFFSIFCF